MYLTPVITATNSNHLSYKNTGLGNVMFQIASTYGLAKQTNRVAVWNNVSIFADILKNKFDFNHKDTIFRKCLSVFEEEFIVVPEGTTWTHNDRLVEFLKNSRISVSLYGYFEVVSYFHQYKEDIMDIFSPDEISFELIRSTYPILFDDAYTTVSIHFRGNEYLRQSDIGHPWDYDFYKRAVKFFKDKFSNIIFLIFSDDMETIDFSFLEDAPYKKMGHKYDYIDLWCLTFCKHNIISRSTFSFWGGYLNKNPDAIIVYNKNHSRSYNLIFQAI